MAQSLAFNWPPGGFPEDLDSEVSFGIAEILKLVLEFRSYFAVSGQPQAWENIETGSITLQFFTGAFISDLLEWELYFTGRAK